MPKQEKDCALVIGINDYPRYRPLEGAIEDAIEFEYWLLDSQNGGGLSKSRCKTILSESDPLKPIQEQIDSAIKEIKDDFDEEDGRRFYFYFSGHGLGLQSDEVGLCLAGWSKIFRNLALSSREYINLIVNSGKFKEVVVFLDCCRVNLINARGASPYLGWPKISASAGSARKFYAYATEFGNSAYEAESNINSTFDKDGSLVRGHFTRALLAALWGGAADQNGEVTAEKLREYLESETESIALESNDQQRAVVSSEFAATQSIIKFANNNLKVNFKFNNRSGMIVLEDSDLVKIHQDDASTNSWDLDLQPGMYSLTEQKTGEDKVFRLRPNERREVHVEF